MKPILLLAFLCAATAASADIDGKWQLTYTTSNGLRREALLDLKTEGATLAGALSSDRGTARIESGEIKGNEISFTLLRKGNGDEIQVRFTGTLREGALELTMQFGNREPVKVHGRRL
jgi:hypothetical protein